MYTIQVTSFSITDTISGSTTGYSIMYGSNIQNKTACVDDSCEYTIDVPPHICSTSSVVDVSVVAANVLGFGQPSEPITLGMSLLTTTMCRILPVVGTYIL